MIHVQIPGRGVVEIHNVVFDYNGTLAVDGKPVEGVYQRLKALADKVNLFIVTADTFGTVRKYFSDTSVEIIIVDRDCGGDFKKEFLFKLGRERTAAVGNGKNDVDMLRESCLGIGIIGAEGCFSGIISCCDIVVTSPIHAIDILLNPARIKATLRY